MKSSPARQIIRGSSVGTRFGAGEELHLWSRQAAQCAVSPHYCQQIRATLLAAGPDAQSIISVRERASFQSVLRASRACGVATGGPVAPAAKAFFLSFTQNVMLVPGERREQIADDTAGSGLHFHGDCHARAKIYDPIVGLQLPLVE